LKVTEQQHSPHMSMSDGAVICRDYIRSATKSNVFAYSGPALALPNTHTRSTDLPHVLGSPFPLASRTSYTIEPVFRGPQTQTHLALERGSIPHERLVGA